MSLDIIKYGNVLLGIMAGTQKGVLKSVIAGASQAKALATEDTGELRNSIGYTAEVSGQEKSGGYNNSGKQKTNTFLESKGSGLEGYYGTALEYAPYIEDGTRRMVAQPFLTPSADIISGSRTAQEIKKEMNDEMKKETISGTKATRRYSAGSIASMVNL